MKSLFTIIAFMSFSAVTIAAVAEPKLPIRSGEHKFKHKFAEQPNMRSIPLIAKIKGRHIKLINQVESQIWPKGVIAEGDLVWHSKSKQWIISLEPSDSDASDVGGCSDGPEVIDLKKKIYWTC